jgi:hypothetical protein
MFEIFSETNNPTVMVNYTISRAATIGELEEIKAEILRKTDHKFDITNEPWSYPNYPFLNIYTFSKMVPKNFKWSIADSESRTKFLKALSLLQELLDKFGIIDSRLTAEILLNDLLKDREKNPLISVGNKIYQLQLRPTSDSFELEQEYKNEVNSAIQNITNEYSSAIANIQKEFNDEIERMKRADKRLFPVTSVDAFDGWSTFFYGDKPVLAKKFTYSPHYLMDNKILWEITNEEVRKYWRTPGVLAYSLDGNIIPLKSNGTLMMTHHTRSSNSLCTGDTKVPPNLEYAAAKDFVRRMVDMLDVINVPSRTCERLNHDDPYNVIETEFYTLNCKKVTKPKPTDTSTVDDGEVM